MIIKNIGNRIHRVIWSCQLTIIRTFTVLFNRLDALELLYNEMSISLGYRIENATREIEYLEKSVALLSNDLKNFGFDSSVVDNIIVDVQTERTIANAIKDELNAPLLVDVDKQEEKVSEKPMDTELMMAIDKELDRIAAERQRQIDENRERLERAQDLTEKVEIEKKNVEESTRQLKQELDKQQQEMQQNLERLRELADSGYDNDYSDVPSFGRTNIGGVTGTPEEVSAKATGETYSGELAKVIENVVNATKGEDTIRDIIEKLTGTDTDITQAASAVDNAYAEVKEYLQTHPGDTEGAKELASNTMAPRAYTPEQREAAAEAMALTAQNIIDAQNAAAGIEAAKERVAELEKQLGESDKAKEQLDEISSLIESATSTIQDSIRYDSSISASEAVHNVGADAVSNPDVPRPNNYVGESVSSEEQQRMEDAWNKQQRAEQYFHELFGEGWHP